MIIGVDFDNTIVCYDAIFYRIALERGLIPAEVPANKTDVRDYLRRVDNELAWSKLQGDVYGPRLVEAEIFPGVKEFFRTCREQGVTVKIISHKSRHPYIGEKHDLHTAARAWLEQNGFFSEDDISLPTQAAFFELSKQDKLARIKTERCDWFIDDLPEFFAEPEFPAQTRQILFDPLDVLADTPTRDRASSWNEIKRRLFDLPDENALDAEVAAASATMFERFGMPLAGTPVRLTGGGNNRVFEARTVNGKRFLLKQYFFDLRDPRNRFEAERRFYRLTAIAAPGHTPRVLAWDADARLALMEFVAGCKLSTGEIGRTELTAALEFFRAINRLRTGAEAVALPLAAEACFTVGEHCDTVDRRLNRLRKISTTSAIDRQARDFVENELSPAWTDLRNALVGGGSEHLEQRHAITERCVSPSDFGFHNCLRRPDGSLVFLDFEYAGWDDPAKTVCDFFCQPALPAPHDAFEFFATEVGLALGLPETPAFVARCRALLPVYQLKWCCIMLNEFVSADRGRRAFALGEGVAELSKAGQLAAARQALMEFLGK